jgi:hypothetical protein
MVLKLIESGGFVGRSRSAALDISTLSIEEQHIIKDFLSKEHGRHLLPKENNRDRFQYSLVYEEKNISLPELPSDNKVLAQVFKKLIDNLRY